MTRVPSSGRSGRCPQDRPAHAVDARVPGRGAPQARRGYARAGRGRSGCRARRPGHIRGRRLAPARPAPAPRPRPAGRAHAAGVIPVDVPTFTATGWYDAFLQGSLDNHLAARATGHPAALVVGPWTHADRSGSPIPLAGCINAQHGRP
ncbi:CocE/NonD family hydrolase [Streptomyces sp. PA03-5A]|nr:CocE/NonD family hydrolase [Streptomyces sp. PA03-5A]